MASAGPTVEELCAQAKESLKRKDVSGAITLFEQAIIRDPDSIPAHEGLATVCFARKDNLRAIELFKRVAELDPRRVDPLVNLGAALNRAGKYQDAVKTLRQALARDRRCAAAYFNLGFAQRGVQQSSMAVSAYKEAIRLSPEMWEAYLHLGQIYLEMGNPTQAALNFERALQIQPQSHRAQQGLLQARARIDEAKNAISPFGRLVDMKKVEESYGRKVEALRPLTAEERKLDRAEVHRLAKECEQCSVALLNQVKEELTTALHAIARLVNDSAEPRSWGRGVELYNKACQRFEQFTSISARKMHELDSHDRRVRAG